ncbi:hypothetical protein BCU90_17525 [Vibrio lentus]|uniref:hypothetical protein n=1 Tax=Vibrio lentus TaxID=136468 RepID=UPI000C8389B4|nr:hypothetical protein [Vibrio lentus]PMG45664.1 hypothetical protein BCU90_17525 [Vibrio lentus]
MKVLKIGEFSPSHTDVVFESRQSAEQRDMTKTIGRFNSSTSEMAFLEDKGLGVKYRALFESGFGLNLGSVNGALYVADINDVIKMNEHKRDYESMSALNEGVESVEYLSESEFAAHIEESETDSFTDLFFSHKSLIDSDGDIVAYDVGQVTSDGKFTLRPDIANLIDSDFEIKVDGDGEWEISNKTLTAKEVVNIIKFLRKADKAEINESVQVDALTEVQKLLSTLRVSKRHGDDGAVQTALGELNAILDSYKDANPPAKGVESVKAEIKKVTKDRDIVTETLNLLRKTGL